jgi:hypothetical protein
MHNVYLKFLSLPRGKDTMLSRILSTIIDLIKLALSKNIKNYTVICIFILMLKSLINHR